MAEKILGLESWHLNLGVCKGAMVSRHEQILCLNWICPFFSSNLVLWAGFRTDVWNWETKRKHQQLWGWYRMIHHLILISHSDTVIHQHTNTPTILGGFHGFPDLTNTKSHPPQINIPRNPPGLPKVPDGLHMDEAAGSLDQWLGWTSMACCVSGVDSMKKFREPLGSLGGV